MLDRIQWWLRQKNVNVYHDIFMTEVHTICLPKLAYNWAVSFAKAYDMDYRSVLKNKKFIKMVNTYMDTVELDINGVKYVLPKPAYKWLMNITKAYDVSYEQLLGTDRFNNVVEKYAEMQCFRLQ